MLSLGDCEVVLEVHWLHTLGPIIWDVLKLSRQFIIQGQQYSLKGFKAPTTDCEQSLNKKV